MKFFGKSFMKSWLLYPVRRVVFKHWKKLLFLLVAALLVIGGMMAGVIKPLAAEVTVPAAETEALNQVAAAISENARVLEEFMDSMDVSEVSEMAGNVSGFIDSAMSGMPTIVIAVVVFVVAFIVLRKVVGR